MIKEQTALVWEISPLPDFLQDHTLANEDMVGRLHEVISRWIQYLSNFSSWADKASFALRYISADKRIRVYLLAVTHNPEENKQLKLNIEVLFRAYDICYSHIISKACEYNQVLSPLEDMELVELYQHESSGFWKLPQRVANNRDLKEQFSWLPEEEWKTPRLIFPWQAPGGSFLIPMECLISQNVSCTLTIFLQPTHLSSRELDWLSIMAQTAQTEAEQSLQQVSSSAALRYTNPSCQLAGRIYIANLRRLYHSAYLVNVHCAASKGSLESAINLCGSVKSVVHEVPIDNQQEETRLPVGCGSRIVTHNSALRKQYETLRFADIKEEDPLGRIKYLSDVSGAATMFRLPINVRGGVPGIAVEQRPPDFHPGPRTEDLQKGYIKLGSLEKGGIASVKLKDFTKHTLITGFTGSGKTVTMLNLLHNLYSHGIPFLVIESAKKEYRGLLNVPLMKNSEQPILIYTVANESCAPFRINPFELLPGVRLEKHLNYLQSCFEGALPVIGPLVSLIYEALYDVYEEKGWKLTDVGPDIGEAIFFEFPDMLDFYKRITLLVEERGYEGEVLSNVQAAVSGRIKPLTFGSRGLIFSKSNHNLIGQPRIAPAIYDLFSRPVILELNDLNIDDKALVTMFLLTFLREYRDFNASPDSSLTHITVVEEAHNILENVSSEGGSEGAAANTRYKTVQAFSNMLSEIRALGEGMIIADQSPEKLAADAMRNTNIQIAHQLRDSNDRKAVANAMIMDDEQQDYVGKLRPGQAALFVTGLEKATFIRVPKYYPDKSDYDFLADKDETFKKSYLEQFPGLGYSVVMDEEVKEHMHSHVSSYQNGPWGYACKKCPRKCLHRNDILNTMITRKDIVEDFRNNYVKRFVYEEIDNKQFWDKTIQLSCDMANSIDNNSIELIWCAFIHLWDKAIVNKNIIIPDFCWDIFEEKIGE